MPNLELFSDVLKDIPSFEGLYKAHIYGFIVSCQKEWISGRGVIRKKECTTLRPAIDKDGYPKVTLLKDGKPFYFRIGRLVAITYHTNPESLPQVNHKDGNKLNSSKTNVEWCTCLRNIEHAWETGLSIPSIQKTGGNNLKAKLKDEQAAEIRNSKQSSRVLGKKYGVHHSIIGGIKKGIRYPLPKEKLL